jgi:hypothetical protein
MKSRDRDACRAAGPRQDTDVEEGLRVGTARQSTSAAFAVLGAMLAFTVPSARAAAVGGVVPDVSRGTPSPHVIRAFGAALDYQGGPVMQTNRTHIIFWNPSNAFTWDPGYRETIIRFLTDVAADSHKSTNVYALTGQYYDNTQNPPVRAEYESTYAGSLDVTYPPRATTTPCTLPPPPDGPGWTYCVNDDQIGAEVTDVAVANGLPAGLTDLYLVVTPDGVGSCSHAGPLDCSLGGATNHGFCGYHTSRDAGGTPYLYAVLPYNDVPPHCRSSGFPQPNGSTADVTISTLSHEHNEAITDPLPGIGNAAWQNAGGIENGDLCSGNFGANLGGSSGSGAYNEAIGSGHYFTQEEWSNEDGGCAARDEADTVDFSSNAPRPPGTPVTFTSGAIDPDGSIVATSWDFGDASALLSGTPATHAFARTGVYQVTLHTGDIGGQWGSVTKSVIVDTPPSARFSAAPSLPVAHRTVRFDAAGSSDSDGSIVPYRWAFGDGTAASGAAPRHVFARAGTFGAVLTVTDNLGVSSSITRLITVAPLPHVSLSFKVRTLRIVVNEPGVIRVGSRHKRVTRAAAVTFKLKLNRRQLGRLNSGHKVRLTLKVTFVPRVGPKLTRRITITIHP